MRKIIIIIILLLTTGCVANYEVTISEDSFTEVLSMSESNELNIDQIFKEYTPYEYNLEYNPRQNKREADKIYYEKDMIDDVINLKYKGIISIYNKSGIVNSCFDNFSASEYEDRYTIKATNFTCFNKYPNLTEINLKVKIDSEIISTNGKKESDGYSWLINKKNSEKTSIEIDIPLEKVEVGKINNYLENFSNNICGGFDDYEEYDKFYEEFYKDEELINKEYDEERIKEAEKKEEKSKKEEKVSSQNVVEEKSKEERSKIIITIILMIITILLVVLGYKIYKTKLNERF